MGKTILRAAVLCAILVVDAAQGQTNAELAQQVRAVEQAFAQSMAERNFEAFIALVSAEAVFFSRKGVLRGPEAVAGVWKPFFADPKTPFSWAPEAVEVLDSGALALSSGPVRDPEGKQVGTYTSVWRREGDGVWRIIFDKGCPPCDCSSTKP